MAGFKTGNGETGVVLPEEEFVEASVAVLAFLVYREREFPDDMWGGRSITEALEGAAKLSGISVEKVRKLF